MQGLLGMHLYDGDLGLQSWRQLAVRAQQVEHGALVQRLHALRSCATPRTVTSQTQRQSVSEIKRPD